MKKKNIFICSSLIIVLIFSIIFIYQNSNKKEMKNSTSGLISFYVEKENNEYEKLRDIKFPTEGYVLNEVKSSCENGSELNWINNKVQLTGNKSDKCTIYFDNVIKDYDYTENIKDTGESYEFIAPASGIYKIELWGASGGYSLGNNKRSTSGGSGAYTAGKIYLEKGTKLYIYVGSLGSDGQYQVNAAGGWNGGGSGTWDGSDDDSAGAGGGATDIRTINGEWNSFESLKSRIMVAAGGGGAIWHTRGGSSGGLVAENIYDANLNVTQTNGYAFGQGMNAYGVGDSDGVGGGGAGYYGGYSRDTKGNSIGGGGSSFISGHTGCIAIDSSSLENNIKPKTGCNNNSKNLECSIHYSNYVFSDTVMIDGLGYKWTTETEEQVGMPSPSGENEMGHNGNGYARITYIGNFKKNYTLIAKSNIDDKDATLTNLVKNGDFENDFQNWNYNSYCEIEHEKVSHGNNSVKFLLTSSTANINQKMNPLVPQVNHNYYGRLMFLSDENYKANDARFEWRTWGDISYITMIKFGSMADINTDKWVLLSNISKITSDERKNDEEWILRNFKVAPKGDSYNDELIVLDLTESYGESIPTKEWLDTNLIYFDDTVNIKTVNDVKGVFQVDVKDGKFECSEGGSATITSDGIVTIVGSKENTTCYLK